MNMQLSEPSHKTLVHHLRRTDTSRAFTFAIIGGGLVAVGLFLTVQWWPDANDHLIDHVTKLHGDHIGLALVFIGALFIQTAIIERKGRDVDAAYRLGFDLGSERGSQDAHAEHSKDTEHGYRLGYDLGFEKGFRQGRVGWSKNDVADEDITSLITGDAEG